MPEGYYELVQILLKKGTFTYNEVEDFIREKPVFADCKNELLNETHQQINTLFKFTTDVCNYEAPMVLSKYSKDWYRIIKKKRIREKIESWPKKYWWAVAAIAYGVGLLTPTFHKIIDRKTWPEPTQSGQATPKGIDTFDSHKIDPLPIQPDSAGLPKPEAGKN